MNKPRPRPRYTYAQYVAIEMSSDMKHEFLDGEIWVTPGGSEDHSKIAGHVIGALDRVLEEPCYVHSSDLRIYVEASDLATFPDASVICGPLQQHDPSPDATAVNPTVLVEVTSKSSEEYDVVTKLDCYRTIPSLREYVIVSHRERRITVHAREADDRWVTRGAMRGGTVELSSIGVRLSVDEIYRGTTITSAD